MANEDLRVRISTQVQGLDQVESLKNAVRQLQGASTPAAADLQKLKNAAMQLGGASGRTESDLRRSINALKDVRAQLSLTGVEYKKLTKTINDYQLQLDKATGAQQRGGRVGQFAQTAGAVAASGVFGGPEGLVGAGIGGLVGGPAGALAGGAIGAQVGMVRQQLGAIATLSADIEKQRTALRLVLKDTAEYNASLAFLAKTSEDYAIPQDQLIRGFTQLAASVKGAGGNINDTKVAFEGVTAGIRGTGGSLENLDAALLATSQVFSKGKVTAEELRGQIGERLPGAFTLFAQSMGKTPQELDKALERGEVSLKDFLTFSRTVFGEYGENAKTIADSPAAAGDRLQTSLKNLSNNVGTLLAPIGAKFQDTFSKIANSISDATLRLSNFLGLNKNNKQKIADLNTDIILTQRKLDEGRERSGGGNFKIKSFTEIELEKKLVRLKAEAQALKALEQATVNQQNNPPKPGLEDKPDPKVDLDRKALEKLARQRQQLAIQTADAQRDLANREFKYQTELDRKRYELQLELTEQLRRNYVDSLVGPRAGVANEFSQLLRELEQFNQRQAEIAQRIASARQEIAGSRAVAAATGAGAGDGAASTIGGFTPQQLSSATSAASKFTGIANMCSESVKAFYASLGITLPGVTAWADTVRNAGTVMRDWSKLKPGDIVATGRPGDTPHVGVYTGGNNVFHQSRKRGLQAGNYPDLDYFKSGYFVRPSAMSGAAAPGVDGREIKAVSEVALREVELNKLIAEQNMLREKGAEILKARLESFSINRAKPIQEETFQIREQISALADRAALELQGARPELIDAAVRKAALVRKEAEELAQLNADLANAKALKNPDLEAQVTQAITNQTTAYRDQRVAIDELTAAQIAFNDAMRFRQDTNIGAGLQEGVQQYIESIGTMREATSQLALNGIQGVEDAIFSLVTTGKANFREFAADILKQTARMIIQQLILRTIMQAIGAISGGGGSPLGFGGAKDPLGAGGAFWNAKGNAFAQNGVVPFAAGGVVDKPTLFKFAKGGSMATGVMGEAGPEAIIPLKRGRDGKLGVAGGGGSAPVTVNVSVDATGSQVQGNAGQGEQLGRVVAQAVQQELVRQKRPGGLLAA